MYNNFIQGKCYGFWVSQACFSCGSSEVYDAMHTENDGYSRLCSLMVKYNLGSHSCNISLGYLGEISLKTYPDVNHLWNLCSYHILNLQNKTCRKTCWTNGYLIFFQ